MIFAMSGTVGVTLVLSRLSGLTTVTVPTVVRPTAPSTVRLIIGVSGMISMKVVPTGWTWPVPPIASVAFTWRWHFSGRICSGTSVRVMLSNDCCYSCSNSRCKAPCPRSRHVCFVDSFVRATQLCMLVSSVAAQIGQTFHKMVA